MKVQFYDIPRCIFRWEFCLQTCYAHGVWLWFSSYTWEYVWCSPFLEKDLFKRTPFSILKKLAECNILYAFSQLVPANGYDACPPYLLGETFVCLSGPLGPRCYSNVFILVFAKGSNFTHYKVEFTEVRVSKEKPPISSTGRLVYLKARMGNGY